MNNGRVVKNANCVKPVMIFPRDTKFASSYEQPHLEMMARLLDALRQPKTGLLVVGFGFADRHIAEPILSALESNVSLNAIVVDPALKARTSASPMSDEYRRLWRFAAGGNPSLALMNATFGDLVRNLPDLTPETSDERFRRHMRGQGGSK